MKMFSVGWLGTVLLPVGIAVAAAGFLVDNLLEEPDGRLANTLQMIGLAALVVGTAQIWRLVNGWQKMLDEA